MASQKQATMEYPSGWGGGESLNAALLNDVGYAALSTLNQQDFHVTVGLRKKDLPAIQAIAGQPGVQEFCPRDSAERFFDTESTTRWLYKGRGMFLLWANGAADLAGYGWTGPEHTLMLPACPNTFALRLNEVYGGNGLATPFGAAIASGSAALYGIQKLGLETWASNYAAFRTYRKIGACLVNTQRGERSTNLPVLRDEAGKRPDSRFYMRFSDQILA